MDENVTTIDDMIKYLQKIKDECGGDLKIFNIKLSTKLEKIKPVISHLYYDVKWDPYLNLSTVPSLAIVIKHKCLILF